MAEVTVSQLAEVVGTPVERLLKQMREAGLSHSQPGQLVSDEDKQTLLMFLKSSHGEDAGEPHKITLKRKTISTLRTGSGAAKKTVSVEVRKKRTYVKRDAEDGGDVDAVVVAEEEAIEPVVAAEIVAESAVIEAPAAEPEEVVQPVAVEPPAPEPVPEPELVAPAPVALDDWKEVPPPPPAPRPELHRSQIDPEVLRQQGALRRKEEELRDRERRDAALAAKRAVPAPVAADARPASPAAAIDANKDKVKKDVVKPHLGVRKRPEDEVEDVKTTKMGRQNRTTTTATTIEPRNVARAQLHVEDFVKDDGVDAQTRRRKKWQLNLPE